MRALVKWGDLGSRHALARAGLVLGVLALIVFLPLALGRQLFERDVQTYWISQLETFVRAVARGSWPVWDPWVAFGEPMLAKPDTQVLYPFTWLNLILPLGPACTLYVLSHVVLAGLGTFLLARRLGTGGGGALVAGAAFMLSGPLLSLATLWHHLAGAAWMPWVLAAAQDTALSKGKPRHALRWGLLIGIQILAGSADMVAMTVVLAAGLVVSHFVVPDQKMRAPLREAGAALAALCLGLGLSAALWMPTIEVARRSVRWALPASTQQYWSFHPLALVQLGLPLFIVDLPLQDRWRQILLEGREPFLESAYVGLPILALAGAALLSRARHTFTVAGAAVLACLIALGRHTPFYAALAAVFPPVAALRYPQKALVPMALSLGLLAGCGFDAWSRESFWRSRRGFVLGLALVWSVTLIAVAVVSFGADSLAKAVLRPLSEIGATPREVWGPVTGHLTVAAIASTGVLFVAVLAASGRLSARRSALVSGALAVAALLVAHRTLNPTAPPELLASRSPILPVLGPARDARILVYDYGAVPYASERYLGRRIAHLVEFLPRGWSYREGVALGLQHYLPAPMAARYGISGSFDRDQRGLAPRWLDMLARLFWGLDNAPAARTRFLQLGGVSHVVALHQTGFEALTEVGRFRSAYVEPIRVFRVPEPLPRSYVVEGTRIVSDQQAIATLLDPRFDFRHEVLLAEGAPARGTEVDFGGESRVITDLPDRVELAVTTRRAGIVVFLGAFDPGWRAWVDGKPERVLRANVSFRAVPVPPGQHRVEMRYWPRSLSGGLAVSALSVVAALAAATLVRRADRRARQGPSSCATEHGRPPDVDVGMDIDSAALPTARARGGGWKGA